MKFGTIFLETSSCSRISICLQWKFEDPVAKAPLETNGAEDPIVCIAPKKPNSDLRRDLAKKLERSTQRAIIELMFTLEHAQVVYAAEEEERLQQAAAAAEEYME